MSPETKISRLPESNKLPCPIVLETDLAGLVLRQMITKQDDELYFELQKANVDYWKEFGNSIDESFEVVTDRRLEHGGTGRFGIWFQDKLVGMVGYSTKSHPREAEIGILLDKETTGKGYATTSVRTLTDYALLRFDRVFAEVEPTNKKSIELMSRVGYQTNGEIVERDWGKALVFEAPK